MLASFRAAPPSGLARQHEPAGEGRRQTLTAWMWLSRPPLASILRTALPLPAPAVLELGTAFNRDGRDKPGHDNGGSLVMMVGITGAGWGKPVIRGPSSPAARQLAVLVLDHERPKLLRGFVHIGEVDKPLGRRRRADKFVLHVPGLHVEHARDA